MYVNPKRKQIVNIVLKLQDVVENEVEPIEQLLQHIKHLSEDIYRTSKCISMNMYLNPTARHALSKFFCIKDVYLINRKSII